MSDRLRDVVHVWNWLPAFRAVAETGQLSSAARALCLSVSALSRTIRLLEDALGKALFVRTGRRFALTRDGQVLLNHVRPAIRFVHDGLMMIRDDGLAGGLRWSCAPALAPLLTDVIVDHSMSEQLDLRQVAHDPNAAFGALLDGSIDVCVALFQEQEVPEHLRVQALEPIEQVVCRPVNRGPSVRDDGSLRCVLLGQGSGPSVDQMRTSGFPWTVVVATQDLMAALRANTEHGLGVLLPKPLAEAHLPEAERLPAATLHPVILSRVPLPGQSSGAHAFAQRIADHWASVVADSA